MRTFWYAGLLLLTGIVLFACQSGDLTVGQSVINPQELAIQSIDTITVQTSTVMRPDSFVTSSDANMVVGRWTDAQTGTLTARSFAALDYTANSLGALTNPLLDSLVLEMNYAYVYGDTTSLFDMSVHRLTQTFPAKVYYSTSSIAYEATPLVQKTVYPRPLSRNKQIRLRMPDDLAQSFFSRLANRQITDLTTLNRFFPGFAFVNNASGNTMAGFLGSTSGLRLYYHTVDNAQTSSSVLFTIASLHFTQIQSDRTGTPLNALQNRSDAVNSRLTDNTTFVWPLAQLQTRIEFPYLDQFARPDLFADVNKAILVVGPVRRGVQDNAPPPNQLELFQTNTQNDIIGQIGGSLSTTGSGVLAAAATYSYDPTVPVFTDTYTFDLTYYLGQIIKQKSLNRSLLLTVPTATSGLQAYIQRVTLGNQQRANDQMQVRLFITSGS